MLKRLNNRGSHPSLAVIAPPCSIKWPLCVLYLVASVDVTLNGEVLMNLCLVTINKEPVKTNQGGGNPSQRQKSLPKLVGPHKR